MIGRTLFICAAILLFANVIAEARVTRIEIIRHEPFAGNQQFGTAGSYEKLVGRFYGELDPAAALNSGIVDLEKAPRNAKGLVEYSSDFYILKPVDLSKGNGALLYDVNNRGNKQVLFQFNSAPRGNDPSTPAVLETVFLCGMASQSYGAGGYPICQPVTTIFVSMCRSHTIQVAQSSKESGTNSFSTIKRRHKRNCRLPRLIQHPGGRTLLFAKLMPLRPNRLPRRSGNLSMHKPSASYRRVHRSQWARSISLFMRQKTRW